MLGNDDIHIWPLSLDKPPSEIERLYSLLSPDERERAGRFVFEKDRARFAAGRGLLRIILARHLDAEPSQLRFSYNAYGKPSLAREHDSDICFNVSHSHDAAIVAIARGREIGADIEQIRPNVIEEQIAERFFSPREVAALRALPAELQPRAFFNCWTRKEAYIKARGDGLSFPLDQFDVSLAPGEPAALLSNRTDPNEVARWSLRDLGDLVPGFAAALAVGGGDFQIKILVNGWNGFNG